MYKDHPLLINPLLHAGRDDITIWRYMLLWKLEGLLTQRALFCSRLDHLSDEFEGSYADPNYTQPPADYSEAPPEMRKILEESLPTDLVEATRRNRKRLFVNCWYESDSESNAMWRLYVQEGRGLAVRSTIRRLQASFGAAPGSQHIARVAYVDYDQDDIPQPPNKSPFWPAICKRKSFAHEQELRVLVLQEEGDTTHERVHDKGILVRCDPETLIEEIAVAPGTGMEFRDTVNVLLARHGLVKPVRRSRLNDRPPYEQYA